VYDFAARLDHAAVEAGWAVLDTGDPAARGALVSGWGEVGREADGTPSVWVTQRVAQARFFMNEQRDVTFSAYLYPYTRSYRDQGVAVLVNGRKVGAWEVEKREAFREYRLTLPAECIERGENTLTLKCRYASRRKNQAVNVARLSLTGVSNELEPRVPAIETRPDGWSQPAGSLVRFRVVVPRGGYVSVWPRFLGGGAYRECRVWLRGGGERRLLASFAEDPPRVVSVPLAEWAGAHGTLEFEVVGPSPVEWTACRVGGHVRAGDANVYLITIDSLRADRVGAYGCERDTTPALDTLARKGTVFLSAYSQSNLSMPSFATMLTGRYPQSHGLHLNGFEMDRQQKPLSVYLGDAGHETAAYVNWGILCWEATTGRGFGRRRAIEGTPRSAARDCVRNNVFAFARNWVDVYWERPQFLWLHSQYLHLNNVPDPYPRMFYHPPPGVSTNAIGTARLAPLMGGAELKALMSEYTERRIELTQDEIAAFGAVYDGAIRFTDDHLAVFLDALESFGLDPYAALIVTSDHGMSLGERHRFSHLGLMLEHLLHVPMIMVLPGCGQVPGARVTDLVESTDIAPTILSYLGLRVPRRMQGRDLMPYIRGEKPEPKSATFAARGGLPFRYAIRAGGWLYTTDFAREQCLESVGPDAVPGESVASEHPEDVARLRETLQQWKDATPDVTAQGKELSEEVKRILKKSGYLPGDG
jgi:arylsulfatase